ncbi:hypothetical protein ACTA71_004096 [Dictyostelium dimigraforme]
MNNEKKMAHCTTHQYQSPSSTDRWLTTMYDSSYAKFYPFCTSNNLDPSDITLVVFMDYLTYLFKLVPSLAYSTINGHRSMLNQLLPLYNKSDIVNDPFIARLMAGIHRLR